MAVPKTVIVGAGLLALVAAAGAFLTRDVWLAWLDPEFAQSRTDDEIDDHPHGEPDRIKLSPQARANLRLKVEPLALQSYWRTVQVPGVVVERRGKGDQSIVAPVAGVIQKIHALPGDVVEPGGAVITLRLSSEPLQTSQTELFKTAQEVKITQDQKARLEPLVKAGTVPEARLLELQYQLDRLNAVRKAYRADLAVKGLQPDMIDRVEGGEFVREMVVRVPAEIESSAPGIGLGQAFQPDGAPKSQAEKSQAGKPDLPVLEVEELKVFPGEQVQAGQLLAHVSNHQNLYIEGRGFREDATLVEKTAASDWPLQASFVEEAQGSWPPLERPLTILYMANVIDPTSQTFPFYVPLPNQYREYSHSGKRYRIWRFRPGQRVQLGVPVQEYRGVFVLPQAAVVREGPDAFVFRQNGDVFERKPVHVVHEDSNNVVIAHDASIFPGNYVAHNAAEALNRALKAQGDEGGGGHHHHDH
jgi:cobalt-zinc-cadmium efflux system membrane fusion protein